jgi:hypothetical protein
MFLAVICRLKCILIYTFTFCTSDFFTIRIFTFKLIICITFQYQNAFQPANDSKKHAIADHEDEMDYYYPFRGDNQCKTVDQRKMTDINNGTPYQ